MENFASIKDMREHLKKYSISNCVCLKLPLFCIDPACEGWGSYASVKIFMQHVVKYQKDQFSDATISLNDSNCCKIKEFVMCIINEVFIRNDVGGVYQNVMDGSHLKTPRTKISAGWKLTVSFQRGNY